MHIIRCMLNFDKHHEVLGVKSKRKAPVCVFRGSVCVQVIFQFTIRVTVKRRVRRALHDLYCLYFVPKVML